MKTTNLGLLTSAAACLVVSPVSQSMAAVAPEPQSVEAELGNHLQTAEAMVREEDSQSSDELNSVLEGRLPAPTLVATAATEEDAKDVAAPENDRTSSKGKQRLRRDIEEVIVTAQKRAERLIDVPMSVSVLSTEAISELGASQLRDFATTVPGLSLTTSGTGSSRVSLRGVTIGPTSRTVAVYLDEVAYGTSAPLSGAADSFDMGLFDLERIEVLRGPQGTLYGASSMGGLLKYVTKKPNLSNLGLDAQAGISFTKSGDVNYNVAAAVNLPVAADKLAIRASGYQSRDGGFIDNLSLEEKDVDSADVYGGRVDALFAPTDALSVRLAAFAQNISRDGTTAADYSMDGVPLDGSLDQRRLLREPFDQRVRLVSATVGYELEKSSLTSVSSFQTIRSQQITDLSGLYVPILQSLGRSYSAVGYTPEGEADKFTQEIRLSSKGEGTLEWIVGGYYAHETGARPQELILRDLNGAPAPNDLFTYRDQSRFEEIAAFVNLTVNITDKFDVTGGVRQAYNRQKFDQIQSGGFGNFNISNDSTDSVTTYLASASYSIADRTKGYVRFSTGYRPGGPNVIPSNVIPGLSTGPSTFKADSLKSYEIGIKADRSDGRIGVDFAGYYIDWSDIQINVIRGGTGYIDNADGGATVRGVELAVRANPMRGASIVGAFAYQQAELSEDDLDLHGRKGEQLPDVPEFTAALNADYEIPLGKWNPTVGASFQYMDDRKTDFGSAAYTLPDYFIASLRAGITINMVEIQIHARNILDERGQNSLAGQFGAAPGVVHVSMVQPRTIGLNLTMRF